MNKKITIAFALASAVGIGVLRYNSSQDLDSSKNDSHINSVVEAFASDKKLHYFLTGLGLAATLGVAAFGYYARQGRRAQLERRIDEQRADLCSGWDAASQNKHDNYDVGATHWDPGDSWTPPANEAAQELDNDFMNSSIPGHNRLRPVADSTILEKRFSKGPHPWYFDAEANLN